MAHPGGRMTEECDNEAFSNWWDSDYDDSTNPYEKDSFAYWAWAGWQAALAQPEQEPVAWWNDTGTHIDLNVSGRGAPLYTAPPQRTEKKMVMWPCLIDTADFSKGTVTVVMQCEDYKVSAGTHWLSTIPPQRTWVALTDEEFHDLQIENIDDPWANFKAIEAKLKEKNT